jgi:hypothetical protein
MKAFVVGSDFPFILSPFVAEWISYFGHNIPTIGFMNPYHPSKHKLMYEIK